MFFPDCTADIVLAGHGPFAHGNLLPWQLFFGYQQISSISCLKVHNCESGKLSQILSLVVKERAAAAQHGYLQATVTAWGGHCVPPAGNSSAHLGIIHNHSSRFLPFSPPGTSIICQDVPPEIHPLTCLLGVPNQVTQEFITSLPWCKCVHFRQQKGFLIPKQSH